MFVYLPLWVVTCSWMMSSGGAWIGVLPFWPLGQGWVGKVEKRKHLFSSLSSFLARRRLPWLVMENGRQDSALIIDGNRRIVTQNVVILRASKLLSGSRKMTDSAIPQLQHSRSGATVLLWLKCRMQKWENNAECHIFCPISLQILCSHGSSNERMFCLNGVFTREGLRRRSSHALFTQRRSFFFSFSPFSRLLPFFTRPSFLLSHAKQVCLCIPRRPWQKRCFWHSPLVFTVPGRRGVYTALSGRRGTMASAHNVISSGLFRCGRMCRRLPRPPSRS